MSVIIRPGRAGEEDAAIAVENRVWAPFHYEADGAPEWSYHPDLWVVAEEDGEIIASADACPVAWDGRPDHLPASWTRVIADSPGVSDTTWVCALGTSVLPERRRSGLSARMLSALAERGRLAGARGMLAPARPVMRAQFPHLPLARFARLRLADGRHADPWLRVHERLGARIIGWSERSMQVSAPQADWERWLSQRLPADGRLLIPGSIGWLSLRGGVGTLSEDSVWMLHPLDARLGELCAAADPDQVGELRAALKSLHSAGSR